MHNSREFHQVRPNFLSKLVCESRILQVIMKKLIPFVFRKLAKMFKFKIKLFFAKKLAGNFIQRESFGLQVLGIININKFVNIEVNNAFNFSRLPFSARNSWLGRIKANGQFNLQFFSPLPDIGHIKIIRKITCQDVGVFSLNIIAEFFKHVSLTLAMLYKINIISFFLPSQNFAKIPAVKRNHQYSALANFQLINLYIISKNFGAEKLVTFFI